MESVNVETKEDILQRHRNEKKDMQCKIQSMKKSVAKGDRKKKKEVAEQTAEIEAKLKHKHLEELNTFTEEDEEPSLIKNLQEVNINGTTAKVSRAEKRRSKKITQLKERQALIEEHDIQNIGGTRHLETQTLVKKLKNLGFVIYDIPSDGNCLYSAIVHQLKEICGQTFTVPEIRLKTSDFIKCNKDDFIPYLSHPDTGEMLTDQQFIEYCNQVANSVQWGGEIELRALSHIFKIPIKVIQAEGSDITIGIEYTNCNKSLILVFHRHMYGLGEHYNSVCPI
ncbi:PREDICTED: OTU domain-containing protein 6B [Diuraphis noxia]|uniref:OTU domain-containing protein 6B n=1 Tax=Diuraphis noxia TaxID=143948 RepID=UPI000763644F|nr:PREDICTED: OTU domain-containing protein 6B [Diuraphis noxia]